ncbi:MAG: PAS domain S-box protein [Candidatus Dojkabacteria bacterium]|jgi:PAS domain S-box-containing protein|nr:PAS domain S-box protein [Candidatus Dojkabacteria bacterium]
MTDPKILNFENISGEDYRKLIDNLPIGIYYGDFKGNIFYCNKRGLEITGFSESDIGNINLLKSDLLSKTDLIRAVKLYGLKMLGKSTGPEEFEITTKDGKTRHIEYYSQNISLEGKSYAVGMFQDITERKNVERNLEDRVAELKELNEAMVGRELKMIELKEKLKNDDSKAGNR